MPHKVKQAREHRRLPHVKEESDGEEDFQDETFHSGHDAPIRKPTNKYASKGAAKELTGRSETLAMEGRYAKIESSPLPLSRALLSSVVGRKGGPSTPVPSWKMYDRPFQGAMEPANSGENPNLLMRGMAARQSRFPRNSVSARKLAASLWEMQGALNPYRGGKDELKSQQHVGLVDSEHHHEGKEGVSQKVVGVGSHQDKSGSSKQSKLSKCLPKSSSSRSPGSPTPYKVEVANDSMSASQPWIVEGARPNGEDGSTLSCELVKVLNQIWSLEEQHNESTSTIASLSSELKKTKAHIKELQREQSSYQEDLLMLNKKLADEKKMLQSRADDAVFAAVKPLKEELEIERKSKLTLEHKHKKLSKEMNEARMTLAKTMQEFEREQKARELMEDVCDELAREIGEDKAKVEELKRQSAKYREEVEQERRMLQMAEVWREERVHMKLAEARFELEEKNASLDRLRSELEAFLRAKRSLDEGNGDTNSKLPTLEQAAGSAVLVSDKHIQGGPQPSKKEMASFDEKRSRGAAAEVEGEDSVDDDLHSIELNRISYSGSHEGPLLSHATGAHSKTLADGMHAFNDAASLPLSGNGVTKGRQGDLSNLSLDRITSTSGKAMMSESIIGEIQEVESQVLGSGPQRGLKDWDLGKRPFAWSSEGLPSLWHDTKEDGVGLNAKGRGGHEQRLSRNGSKGKSSEGVGDGVTSKLEVFELSQDCSLEAQSGDGLLSIGQQAATFPSSPSRKWTHSWSSPDPVNSSKASQPIESMPKGFKDTSLRARLLEAKLEGQQAKLRSSKTAPITF